MESPPNKKRKLDITDYFLKRTWQYDSTYSVSGLINSWIARLRALYPRISDKWIRFEGFRLREKFSKRESKIDYENPNDTYKTIPIHIAYIQRYFCINANLIHHIISENRKLCDLLLSGKETIKIACFGGGPGTEVIGIAKYCLENGISLSRIEFTVYDGAAYSWKETFEILRRLFKEFEQLNVRFKPLVLDPKKRHLGIEFPHADYEVDYDLILCSHLISELLYGTEEDFSILSNVTQGFWLLLGTFSGIKVLVDAYFKEGSFPIWDEHILQQIMKDPFEEVNFIDYERLSIIIQF